MKVWYTIIILDITGGVKLETRQCTKCHVVKGIEEYGRYRRRDGAWSTSSQCRQCTTEKTIADRQKRATAIKDSPEKQVCKKCGQEKFLADFPPYRRICKQCDNQTAAQKRREQLQASNYYESEAWQCELERRNAASRRKTLLEKGEGYCIRCERILPLTDFYLRKNGGPQATCKKCHSLYLKEHRSEKPRIFRARPVDAPRKCLQCGELFVSDNPKSRLCETCRADGKERERIQRSKCKTRRSREKRATDPAFRLKRRISEQLRAVLHGQKGSTAKWIGCTKVFLISYITSLFTEGMTWENYGTWHIDHIVPQAFFDYTDPEQVRICWNYRNLRPLWATDNLLKGDSLPSDYQAIVEEIKQALYLI